MHRLFSHGNRPIVTRHRMLCSFCGARTNRLFPFLYLCLCLFSLSHLQDVTVIGDVRVVIAGHIGAPDTGVQMQTGPRRRRRRRGQRCPCRRDPNHKTHVRRLGGCCGREGPCRVELLRTIQRLALDTGHGKVGPSMPPLRAAPLRSYPFPIGGMGRGYSVPQKLLATIPNLLSVENSRKSRKLAGCPISLKPLSQPT